MPYAETATISADPLVLTGELLLGCDADRPTAHAGDHIEIAPAGLPAFGVLSHTLVPAPTQEAA